MDDEPSLAVGEPAVAAQRAARVHDPMTRHEELDRASFERVARRPAAAGVAGHLRDVAVGPQLAEGDRRGDLQDPTTGTPPGRARGRQGWRTLGRSRRSSLRPRRADRCEVSRRASRDGAESLLEQLDRLVGVLVVERGRHDASFRSPRSSDAEGRRDLGHPQVGPRSYRRPGERAFPLGGGEHGTRPIAATRERIAASSSSVEQGCQLLTQRPSLELTPSAPRPRARREGSARPCTPRSPSGAWAQR